MKYIKPSEKTTHDSCDILITYEIKNREIENLCLIKYELEKRGYSVRITNLFDSFFSHHKPIDAKLVLVPEYYKERLSYYASSYTFHTDKIFNMFWEQINVNKEEQNVNSSYAIKDWGRVAAHIAWGSNMKNRLINEWGCNPSHVFMTGHVTLDYLRNPLVSYYDSRETVLDSFGIPKDKKVHLFVSSLSAADADMRVMKGSTFDNVEDIIKYKKLNTDTRKAILDWFEKILSMDEDSVIIYRPHPEEKGNKELYDLAKRQNRFFVISEKSIKQWIIACDKIYAWMSTAVAEIVAAGKDFSVLRPLPIPTEEDYAMYGNFEHITTFEEFQKEFLSDKPKDKELVYRSIEKYYYIPENRYSYELVCDAIEQVLNSDEYIITPPLKNRLLKWYYPERIMNVIKRMIANSKLCEKYHNSKLFTNNFIRENIDDIFYVKDKLKKNYVSEEEISMIMDRIKTILS